MQLRKSEKKRAKIKMALQGPSGSGKTYSSLLLAKGLSGGDFSKVAVIDSESGSSDLYSDLGDYNVLTLKPPFTPENYIKAIEVCEKAGIECCILDSLSHTWEELLDYHSKLPGNSFLNWRKINLRLNALVNKILQSPCHVIATLRTKQDYILNQKDGKYIPEKVGLKSIMKDGIDFEFTIVFDIDIKNYVRCSKDRANLFFGKPEFKINPDTGKRILDWCNSGTDLKEARQKIKNAKTIDQLKVLYAQYSNWSELLEYDFKLQKDEILSKEELLNPKNIHQNGVSQSK